MFVTILVFFIILGVLVIVHEAGHFFVARRAGVKVDEFGFGLPPRLIGIYRENGRWRIAGPTTPHGPKTIYSINWLPLGCFVKIKGEQGEDTTDPDSFTAKSVGRRFLIVSAGVSMNIVLAVVLLWISFTVGSPQAIDPAQTPKFARVDNVAVRIAEVLPNAPAAQAGIKVGDAIVQFNAEHIDTVEEFQEQIRDNGTAPASVIIRRDNADQTLSITPAQLEGYDQIGVGVALATTGTVSFPWYVGWWYAIVGVASLVWGILSGFYIVLKNLIFSQELVGEVYGPVGIAGLVGDAVDLGWLYVVQLSAVLSVILAVVNYLPIPALDGGRALFLVIEKIRGKAINAQIEGRTHTIGFMLLLALIALVTFQDIARIIGGMVR
jgi:regulator of sigma E protease